MGKPAKRPRLTTRTAVTKHVIPSTPSTRPAADSIVQKTKGEKRAHKHDVFLKSNINLQSPL